MNCPHCNVFNPDDARFCAACGKATSATEPVSHPHMKAVPEMIGKEIAGRYRILTKLGEGGMGAVYKAEQISLKRQCAVKLLRPDVAGTAIMLARFNAEAQAVAKLSHPNTVGIYDFGQDADGSFFIAMEFVEGKSLRETLHTEGPFPLRRALAIASQVAASLTDAHGHSIVHRDLKPDNVMLQTRGRQKDVARVLDFGIAKLRDEGRATQQAMTQAGDMLGTPQYMAPEQIRGEQIDGRTDVYALGCMLYEMITARMPFEAPTIMALLSKHLMENPPAPSQRRPDLSLPPYIDQLIMAAISKDPNARPPTMEIFGEQIAQLLAQLPASDTSQVSAPMSAVQAAASPTAPNYGTPQGAYGAYTPPVIAPTAPVGGFQPPPPPPGPAPAYSPYGFQTPPAQASPVQSGGGNSKMWIAIIAVVVLLGGTAAVFALAFRGGPKEAVVEGSLDAASDKPVAEKDKDKPEKDKPANPKKNPDEDDDDSKIDPWSGKAGTDDPDVNKFLDNLQALKTQLCACTTKACGDTVSASAMKFQGDLAKIAPKLATAGVGVVQRLTQIQTEMAACATRIATGGATKPKVADTSINAEFDRYADRACACKDVACGQKLLVDLAVFAQANKNKDGDEARAQKTAVRMMQCLINAGMDQQTVIAAFQALAAM